MDRITIKFAGASGQGINATGHIFTKVLNSIGLQTFGYREYPSLIKGGVASYQVDCSSKPINSSTKKQAQQVVDVVLEAVDTVGLEQGACRSRGHARDRDAQGDKRDDDACQVGRVRERAHDGDGPLGPLHRVLEPGR